MSGIELRVATESDRDQVLEFIREHYYREESLTIGTEPKQQDAHDEKFSMSNLAHGTCVIAEDLNSRDANGGQAEIVGVLLAGPKYRGEAEHLLEEADRLKGTKWGTILSLLARVEAKSNVFDRYKVDSAVHGHVMGVHQRTRGNAIGAQLIRKSMETARQLGFPVWTSDCTSVYSAKVCEKLGMEHLSTFMYAEYCDDSGQQVCNPPAIHDCVKTFAQVL